jgi:nucleoside-diphosphate-sugar epimerase
VGSALVELLLSQSDADGLGPQEILSLYGSKEGAFQTKLGSRLSIQPISQISPEDLDGAHVVHLSFLTKDKINQLGEEEFLKINQEIDAAVLGAMSKCQPSSIFVASSGAARELRSPTTQKVDSYTVAKRRQERGFLAIADAQRIPIVCGRIFSLAGPHINKHSNYAVSNFISQALLSGKIDVFAEGAVYRSFLHVSDLCRIIIRSARAQLSIASPVDLCGEEVTEMRELARLIASKIDGTITCEKSPEEGNHSHYVGDFSETKSIAHELNLELLPLRKQIEDTIRFLKKTNIYL